MLVSAWEHISRTDTPEKPFSQIKRAPEDRSLSFVELEPFSFIGGEFHFVDGFNFTKVGGSIFNVEFEFFYNLLDEEPKAEPDDWIDHKG